MNPATRGICDKVLFNISKFLHITISLQGEDVAFLTPARYMVFLIDLVELDRSQSRGSFLHWNATPLAINFATDGLSVRETHKIWMKPPSKIRESDDLSTLLTVEQLCRLEDIKAEHYVILPEATAEHATACISHLITSYVLHP